MSAEGPSTRTCSYTINPPSKIARLWSTVKTYSLVVDDLDNGSKSAGEGVIPVDGDNAANLNEAPVGSLNHCFAHCDGCSIDSLSVAKSI